jgi:AcrR family transcriptional regulator
MNHSANGTVFPQPVGKSEDAILNAAEGLISINGYAGFSMRELAEASGLAKGTIYHHFRDKQDVYTHVMERQMLSLQAAVAQAAAGHTDPVNGLRAVIETYFTVVSKRRNNILATLRDNKDAQVQLHTLAEKHRDGFLQPIADLVRQGIAAGSFRPVDVEMTVISLLGMMNAFVTHRLLLDQVDLDQHMVDHTLGLLLLGINTPASLSQQ